MNEKERKLVALAAYWASRASGRASKAAAERDAEDAVKYLVMAGVNPTPLPPHPHSKAQRIDEFCRALCDRLGISQIGSAREASDIEWELGL